MSRISKSVEDKSKLVEENGSLTAKGVYGLLLGVMKMFLNWYRIAKSVNIVRSTLLFK